MRLLFSILLLIPLISLGQTNVFPTYTSPYFLGDVRIKDTLGVDGFVGIGTSTPSSKLHINDSVTGNELLVDLSTATRSDIFIGNDTSSLALFGSSADNNGARMFMIGRDHPTLSGDIFVDIGGYNDTGNFVIRQLQTSGGVPELMRVTNDGNVGIGTDTPSQKLTINGEKAVLAIGDVEGVFSTPQPSILFADGGFRNVAFRYKKLTSILPSVYFEDASASGDPDTWFNNTRTDFIFRKSVVFVGDTSNSNMTQGLTLNQLTAGNQILALKSSDVAHAMTSLTEADTYGWIQKKTSTAGGISFRGVTETSVGMELFGYETTANSTKGTGGTAAVIINTGIYNGVTSVTRHLAQENLFGVSSFGLLRFIVDQEGSIYTTSSTSKLFINEATNVNMTAGITLNQSGADNEIIALKSSDVAHGITGETETDTYGTFSKVSVGDGALRLRGFGESNIGIQVDGNSVADVTTKTTTSNGTVLINARKKTGTTTGSVGANGNLVVMKNNSTTRWILDAEGDIFYGGADDGTISDVYDDIHLLEGFRAIMSPKDSPAEKRFKGFVKDSEDILVHQGVLTAPLKEGGLVSDTGLKGLIIDAIRQVNENVNCRIDYLSERMQAYEAYLTDLGVDLNDIK